jgi:hypothetical protein
MLNPSLLLTIDDALEPRRPKAFIDAPLYLTLLHSAFATSSSCTTFTPMVPNSPSDQATLKQQPIA